MPLFLCVLDQFNDGIDRVEVLRGQVVDTQLNIKLLHQLGNNGYDVEGIDDAVVNDGGFVLKVVAGADLIQNFDNFFSFFFGDIKIRCTFAYR